MAKRKKKRPTCPAPLEKGEGCNRNTPLKGGKHPADRTIDRDFKKTGRTDPFRI